MPLMNDDQVELAESRWNEEDEAAFELEFGILSIRGRTGVPEGPIIAVSLFWKSISINIENPHTVTREALVNPGKFGIVTRCNPWHHYVEPLLLHGPRIIAARPEVTIQVYLANDLFFLEDELSQFCQVRLMSGSSERSAPGMLWRFLALESTIRSVTVIDLDLLRTALLKLSVTEMLRPLQLGTWRCPVPSDLSAGKEIKYRTIAGGIWGSRVNMPMGQLLRAFRWHQRNGSLSTTGIHPGLRKQPLSLYGSTWPDYGSDEFFLNVVMYPRLAEQGLLTLLYRPRRSALLPLDIEYATWANADSTIDWNLLDGLVMEPIRDKEGREMYLELELPFGEIITAERPRDR